MTHGKLIAAGLFAVAAALLSIAWAIHSNGSQQRFELADKRGVIFDTATGELKACQRLEAADDKEAVLDCKTLIADQR